ncbi:hypothetical protein CLOM_g12974 [Closterium sp. NIES-68]|nr:hypothetical protein CLOM_g12974 [Closterium sp. NIES-68]GJP80065.1 hypothetical protein CLOP_g10299 [Closterium sp. NIES-67]
MSPPLPPSYSVSIPTSTGNPRDRERRLLQRRLRRSVGGAAAPSSPSTVVAFVVALQLLWLLPARAPCTVAAATISKDPGAPTGGTMAARTAGLTSGLPPETLGSAPGRDAETRSASSSDSSRSGPGRSSVATTMTTTMMMLMRGAETQSTGSRSPSRTEWEDCSREPTVEVRDVFMAPDPPVIGHQFELQLPAVATDSRGACGSDNKVSRAARAC